MDKQKALAPLTPAHIKDTVINEAYWQPEGTTLTVCCLYLKNGFTVTGESATISEASFCAEKGKLIARKNALDKIWALEGYLAKEQVAALARKEADDANKPDQKTTLTLSVTIKDGNGEHPCKLDIPASPEPITPKPPVKGWNIFGGGK